MKAGKSEKKERDRKRPLRNTSVHGRDGPEFFLRQGEHFYKALLDYLPQRIFLKDEKSTYLSCNKAFAEDLGMSPEEIVGKTDYDFFPRSVASKYRADDRRILKRSLSEDLEEKYVVPARRREMIVETVKTPIFNEKGEPVGILGIFWDISERKKSEAELAATSLELKERVKELDCLYAVSALRESLGLSLDELVQGTVDLIPPSWQYPDITCARITLEGRDYRTEDFVETRWKQVSAIESEGARIGSVEVFYRQKMPPRDEGPFLKEERKLLDAVSELIERMIEQKRTFDMLESERDKFRGMLDALGEGVYIVNPEYVIEYQNRIQEQAFRGAVGSTCYETYMSLEGPCKYCLAAKAVESQTVRQTEAILSDGQSYDIIFSPYSDVDSGVKIIVLLRNVTEKKRMEAEAMRAGHLSSLGELAAGVAHEINNPINGIINYAELLEEALVEQTIDSDIPHRIAKEAERIAQIVRNLLTFARDEDEEYVLSSVEDILKDALDLVGNQLRKDGVNLTLRISPSLPMVLAHGQSMQQVFLNLISNSRYSLNQKFRGTGHDKRIDIEARRMEIEGGMYVRLRFCDNGAGIPADILDCICNPFFSTKPKGEGTGLGLSISHGIVNKHKGRLWFRSIEGEYTEVFVDLPVPRHSRVQAGPVQRKGT